MAPSDRVTESPTALTDVALIMHFDTDFGMELDAYLGYDTCRVLT